MAIKELARLAAKAESETARVAAIKELLDRGYGKAMQPIQGTVEYGISEQLSELFKENAAIRASRCFADMASGQRIMQWAARRTTSS